MTYNLKIFPWFCYLYESFRGVQPKTYYNVFQFFYKLNTWLAEL